MKCVKCCKDASIFIGLGYGMTMFLCIRHCFEWIKIYGEWDRKHPKREGYLDFIQNWMEGEK